MKRQNSTHFATIHGLSSTSCQVLSIINQFDSLRFYLISRFKIHASICGKTFLSDSSIEARSPTPVSDAHRCPCSVIRCGEESLVSFCARGAEGASTNPGTENSPLLVSSVREVAIGGRSRRAGSPPGGRNVARPSASEQHIHSAPTSTSVALSL